MPALTKQQLIDRLAQAIAEATYEANEAKYHDRMASAARARRRPYQQRIDRYTKALDRLASVRPTSTD